MWHHILAGVCRTAPELILYWNRFMQDFLHMILYLSPHDRHFERNMPTYDVRFAHLSPAARIPQCQLQNLLCEMVVIWLMCKHFYIFQYFWCNCIQFVYDEIFDIQNTAPKWHSSFNKVLNEFLKTHFKRMNRYFSEFKVQKNSKVQSNKEKQNSHEVLTPNPIIMISNL